jgi:transposase
MELHLSPAERHALRALQGRCRERADYVPVTVVLLLDKGRSVPSIADDLGVSVATVYRYAGAYQAQGLAAFRQSDTQAGGYWGLLSSGQLAHLCQELGRHLYTDCRQIADWLALTCHVQYAVSGLTDLLHRLGFSYKLTTAVPCEADAARQQAFLTDTLRPLLAQAEAGTAAVYFADAAHPTHNTRATHVWTATGKERPLLTVSGRERVNLNAALNAVVPTHLHLDETDCVNAQSTRRLYEQLREAHPVGPVYVLCDNARYYKNKALTTWLTDTRLMQVFLPPYSPNLNLIERFWKFLRQKIINTAFYRTKGAFKTAVLDFFTRLDEFGPELTSLLTRNFHILDAQPTS